MRIRFPAFVLVLVVASAAWLGTGLAAAEVSPSPLTVNEFLADNDNVIADEHGEFDDVLELYNAGPEPVDLGGMYLTDDLDDPLRFRITDTVTIPAGGFVVFWADSSPEQGIYHTNFSLGKSGESIGLFDTDANGNSPLDTYTFGPQTTDVSEGRCPDGAATWLFYASPTIGAANGPCGGPSLTFLPLIVRGTQADAPTPLPLRLDCGSDAPYTTRDGTLYLADHAWEPGAPYGSVGGRRHLPAGWEVDTPVGGTEDDDLFKTQRLGWSQYIAGGISNGDYLLSLHFEEVQTHGPGFSVWDLVAEGQTLLDDFDLWAHAGRQYALDLRFAVTVTDGEFNLLALPSAGEASLAALELVPRSPDSDPPAVPAGLEATSGYGAVLLDWAPDAEDDVAGYHVYRATQPAGPYTRLTAGEPVFRSRYQDDVPVPHVTYYYRVSAVDAYGNESSASAVTSGIAVELGDATLPLYRLAVSPANLSILLADPFLDNRVPGTFTWQGETLDVEVRFRGNVGRNFDKKSWKIVFDPASSPFPNHDRINVNANWLDPSLIHAGLATTVFTAAGLRPPQAEMVLLTLNGDFVGVYTRNEQIDEGFLRSSGRNPGATIYKVGDRFGEVLPDEATYRRYYEKETNEDLPWGDLMDFMELINDTPDDQFAAVLSQVMDVETFLDHYAIIVLTANDDSATRNIYLVHDLDTGQWELVPYDLDWGFTLVDAPIDLGTLEHPEGTGNGSILRSRVLAVPQFRAYFCHRLAEYLDTIFSPAVMQPQIRALHYAIQADGVRDWRKWGWEDSSDLLNSLAGITSFVTLRGAYLEGEMRSFCPAP